MRPLRQTYLGKTIYWARTHLWRLFFRIKCDVQDADHFHLAHSEEHWPQKQSKWCYLLPKTTGWIHSYTMGISQLWPRERLVFLACYGCWIIKGKETNYVTYTALETLLDILHSMENCIKDALGPSSSTIAGRHHTIEKLWFPWIAWKGSNNLFE